MLRTTCSLLIIVVMVLVQGCSKPAENAEDKLASTMTKLEQKIEGPIIARNQDFDVIVKMLQEGSGLILSLDPGIAIKVTFSLESPTLREILDTVLPANGLAYCITGADRVRIGKREVLEKEGVKILSPAIPPSDKPVDLTQMEGLKKTIDGPVIAKNQSIQTMIQLLQAASQIQFVLDEGISNKISLNLTNPTVGEVLEAIMKDTGLEYSVQNSGVVMIRRKSTP